VTSTQILLHLDTFKDIWELVLFDFGYFSFYDLDTFKDIWELSPNLTNPIDEAKFRYLQGYMGTNTPAQT